MVCLKDVTNWKYEKLLLFGDTLGIPQLLDIIPNQKVAAIIVANNRSGYHKDLIKLANIKKIKIFIQPAFNHNNYYTFVENIKALKPDFIICNSYSMIIQNDILELVNHNALNVHWALLPHNRGPNPTQWAIIKGENVTGVTIHYITQDLDSGDIVAQVSETIQFDDTWVTVNKRLESISYTLLASALPKILSGNQTRTPQNRILSSKNYRLTPDFPRIDFKYMDNKQIYNLIRAQVEPLRGAYIQLDSQRLHFPHFLTLDQVYELRQRYSSEAICMC